MPMSVCLRTNSRPSPRRTSDRPKADEIKLIGNRLLQQQTQKGWIWDSKTTNIPSACCQVKRALKIKTDPAWGKLVSPQPRNKSNVSILVTFINASMAQALGMLVF